MESICGVHIRVTLANEKRCQCPYFGFTVVSCRSGLDVTVVTPPPAQTVRHREVGFADILALKRSENKHNMYGHHQCLQVGSGCWTPAGCCHGGRRMAFFRKQSSGWYSRKVWSTTWGVGSTFTCRMAIGLPSSASNMTCVGKKV